MFWKVSRRSEWLYYNSSHTTSLPVVRHNYKGFNIAVKKALAKAILPTGHRLPMRCLYVLGPHAGLEMKNKTIRGQTEGMSRNHTSQLGGISGIGVASLLKTGHCIRAPWTRRPEAEPLTMHPLAPPDSRWQRPPLLRGDSHNRPVSALPSVSHAFYIYKHKHEKPLQLFLCTRYTDKQTCFWPSPCGTQRGRQYELRVRRADRTERLRYSGWPGAAGTSRQNQAFLY